MTAPLFPRETARGPATPQGAPLPALERPRLVVSLSRQTLTLSDASGDFVRRFPVASGRPGPDGRSLTPTGEFRTGPDPSDTWWYIPRRTHGHPFVRLDARNDSGGQPFGLHGPRDARFEPGRVTDGCVRLDGPAIRALYDFLRRHPGTPVHISD